MEALKYPGLENVKNMPLVELGVYNGIAGGYERAINVLDNELKKYQVSSKEYNALYAVKELLKDELLREEIRADRLQEVITQSVSYKQQNRKQSIISKLFGGLKR